MINPEFFFMGGFLLLIVLMLGIDLGVVNRKNHVIHFKEATIWTLIWISVSMLFYLLIRFRAEWIHGVDSMEKLVELNVRHAHQLKLDASQGFSANLELYRKAMSLEYLTGYLIEKALSVDNIFVIIMIFMSFKVEEKYFHKVLFWGILGAIVMRFLFIFISAALIQHFSWILWIFGAILIYTGVKMFLERNKKGGIDVEHHPVVRFVSRYFPLSKRFNGGKFFERIDGKRVMTPLFLVLLVVEFSDVIFAVDSIPAIFSVTRDPYIVFFSNIFAILGLRSLFFMLNRVLDLFAYLSIGLAVLLVFIGVKMLLHSIFHVQMGIGLSLFIIMGILSLSIIASLLFPPKKKMRSSLSE